jgi:hypothetical protein
MPYKALTYINIPPNNRKAPGDTITDKEFNDADPEQEEEQINALLASGAISEDMEAAVDEAHAPVEVMPSANPLSVDIVTGEVIEGSDESA